MNAQAERTDGEGLKPGDYTMIKGRVRPRRLTEEELDRVIAALQVAGFHEDKKAFARLYVENRISYRTALDSFEAGRQQRIAIALSGIDPNA